MDPQFDVVDALAAGLLAGLFDHRLCDVDAERVAGGADPVGGGQQGGAQAAADVEEPLSGLRAGVLDEPAAHGGEELDPEPVVGRRGLVEGGGDFRLVGGGGVHGQLRGWWRHGSVHGECCGLLAGWWWRTVREPVDGGNSLLARPLRPPHNVGQCPEFLLGARRRECDEQSYSGGAPHGGGVQHGKDR
ncbi:UNVERIFIED_CONTAM: hypothetical protein RKD43_007243 [Streptomyces graminofaciens]